MAFLRDVSNRFWSYVSPRKTQQRRNNNEYKLQVPPIPQQLYNHKEFNFKVSPIPKHAKSGSQASPEEISPKTLVQRWNRAPSQSDSGSIDGAMLPPSPPISFSPPTSLERPYTDMEGDTMIDSMVGGLNPDSDDEWDANEETTLLDPELYLDEHKALDGEYERERREAQGRELRAAGWTEDAIFLFQKLGMRGFEPLLPSAWIDDFKMLPLDLFTRTLDKAFIKPMSHELEYHAWKALDDLFGLGGRARDAVLQRARDRTAERLVRKAVLKYNKWALKDGDIESIWNDVSLFETVSSAKGESTDIMEARMIHKLDKLASLWRAGFRERKIQNTSSGSGESCFDNRDSGPELPTLYGVITSHTIMAFVSYDVHAETPLLRTVAMFDFGQEGYDVWNSLAVAIFVIHCRNRMMQLQDSLPLPENTTTDSDPDA